MFSDLEIYKLQILNLVLSGLYNSLPMDEHLALQVWIPASFTKDTHFKESAGRALWEATKDLK